MFEKLNIFFMYQKYILVDFVLIFAGYSRNVFLGPFDELDWARKYISMVSGVELLKPIGIRKWVDPIGLGWDYVFSIFFSTLNHFALGLEYDHFFMSHPIFNHCVRFL